MTPVRTVADRRWRQALAGPLGRAGALACGTVWLLAAVNYCFSARSLFLADGYIYLKYAWNIAEGAGWVFNPGETSFAATSPLWTVILVPLHWVFESRHGFELASMAVGLAFFSAFVLIWLNLVRHVGGNVWLPFGVLFAALPFNGVFYAMSAMETGLYLFLFYLFVWTLFRRRPSWARSAILGAIGGLLFLTRPEGVLCLICFWLACWIVAADGRNSFLGRLAVSWAAFVLVVAPWQTYIYLKSGILIPTSGTGRLYGYLQTAIPGADLAAYARSSPFERVLFFDEILDTSFFQHPVVLVFCLLPLCAVVILFGYQCLIRPVISPRLFLLSLFVVLYSVGNLFLYLLFQPLIYQRYLVTFLPSALLLLTAPPVGSLVARLAKPLFGLGFVLALLSQPPGFEYYKEHAALNYSITSLFSEFEAKIVRAKGEGQCRLATEPLGLAGYYTSCYVIDLGGLIDPEIWRLWLNEKGDGGAAALDYSYAVKYALLRDADYLAAHEELPGRGHFSLLLQTPATDWAIFERVREAGGPAK